MTGSRDYPVRPFVAASAAVLRNGRVLVAARARPPLRALFSLPGGLVEPGETLAEAALRELSEETGIAAAIIGPLAPIQFIDRDDEGRIRHHFVICPHLAQWVAGEPQIGDEALAFRWLAESEIGSVPTTPDLDGVLREAFARASAGDRAPSSVECARPR